MHVAIQKTDKQKRESEEEKDGKKDIVRERRQNLERVLLVWSLTFDQSGLGGPTRRRSSRQLSSQGRRDTQAHSTEFHFVSLFVTWKYQFLSYNVSVINRFSYLCVFLGG